MKDLRLKTLWRVPVYCLLASWISFQITAHLGGFFFATQTLEAGGTEAVSADPLRGMLFQGALFLIVLLLGGLWFFRSMTKLEIAVSAAIISTLYLTVVLLQLFWSGFPRPLSLALAEYQNWTSFIASVIFQVTGLFELSVIVASCAPFLFVPFGKRSGYPR